ncbi:MAG: polymer-forming cytoskeletal protein [Verrucomicrobia bacterium]|nr:polymer-forming cytoskeletal protein [Verrucomicrobiota bacterium]
MRNANQQIQALQGGLFPCYYVKMFTRTNGRKSDSLDATFSYPEASKSDTARIETISPRSALITDQVEIKGTLAFDGSLEFNGTFEGEIISQGTLSIGAEAVIKAEIHAAKVIIKGKVQGNITATESIELCDQAELFGDVRTAKFIVAETATFRGRSDPIEGKAAAPEFSPVFRRLGTKSGK